MEEDSKSIEIVKCLNCGKEVLGNFCTNCGQKSQGTKIPIKFLVSDAIDGIFNIDNRAFTSIKALFWKPGAMTLEYLSGKRISHLPPFRLYLIFSVLYFFTISQLDLVSLFMISVGSDGTGDQFGKVLSRLMIVMVPYYAFLTHIFHSKGDRYYIESLILGLHVHAVWFVFFSIQTLSHYYMLSAQYDDTSFVGIVVAYLWIIVQVIAFVFHTLYIRNVFKQRWLIAILKSVFIFILYFLTLTLITLLYLKVFLTS